jgi:ATP-binding cassette subfamily B protein
MKMLSNFFRMHIISYLNRKLELDLTLDTFYNVLHLPYLYYRNHRAGEISSRLSDLALIRDMLTRTIVTVFVDLPLSLIALVILVVLSLKLAVASLIIFFLYLLLMLIFTPLLKEKLEEAETKKCDYSAYMIETINGFESIKGNNLEKNVQKTFESKFMRFLNELFGLEKVLNLENILSEGLAEIGNLVLLFVGYILIINNSLTLGILLVFNSAVLYFLNPVRSSIELDVLLKKASISLKRLLEFKIEVPDNGKIESKISGNLQIKNLSFSYDDITDILKNVSLNIKAKEKVMIIGKSGSGKSSLAGLLMHYYEVKRNKIFFDDIDINDYSLKSINESICFVNQNGFLFTDTLYNNIAFNRDIDAEKVLKVTKLCQAEDIVNKSNLGFNYLIEENGFNLSGGEKQRIILARALVRNFEILIIDEGLNQVDKNLERVILKNIFKEYKDKTIIVISHRLENMDLFDRVIEITKGKIKEDLVKNG